MNHFWLHINTVSVITMTICQSRPCMLDSCLPPRSTAEDSTPWIGKSLLRLNDPRWNWVIHDGWYTMVLQDPGWSRMIHNGMIYYEIKTRTSRDMGTLRHTKIQNLWHNLCWEGVCCVVLCYLCCLAWVPGVALISFVLRWFVWIAFLGCLVFSWMSWVTEQQHFFHFTILYKH